MFKTNQEFPGVTTASESAEIAATVSGLTETPAIKKDSFADFLTNIPDLVCMSHLRWDFVYQRPQHLLSRFAKHTRVFFFEEPVFYDNAQPHFDISKRGENITVLVAHLPNGLTPAESDNAQIKLIDAFMAEQKLNRFMLWYYTPMALEITRHLRPELTVFDVMDELSAFKFAPPRLLELEAELFQKADVVFTGGHSLYEVKKNKHPEVYAFPSSIDKNHFVQARKNLTEPADQRHIPHPCLGFFGVIDERFDIELLRELAAKRPDWHFVMIGPVVKIAPEDLPKAGNIHYLGGKKYEELPAYLASWDVALLLFADNDSTKFISPTKTPEYLAAGKPVVSTPIRDVVNPYGKTGLVHIAKDALEFERAIEAALKQQNSTEWLEKVDSFLANFSWDQTWNNMATLMQIALSEKSGNA